MTDSQTRWVFGIFSLLVGAAGWFYMFYSRAAQKLAAIENPSINRRRILMRRLGGSLMIGLAVVFYIGCDALLRHDVPLFVIMMVAVLALMAAILLFGLIDLRLTQKLRQERPPSDHRDN